MTKLNIRQEEILRLLTRESLSNFEIIQKLTNLNLRASKSTINRDIADLIEKSLIAKINSGKNTKYEPTERAILLSPTDLDYYFKTRSDKHTYLNKGVFKLTEKVKLFSDQEEKHLRNLAQRYKVKVKTIDSDILRKEIERLTIDLSWKSSAIEGSTYDLLETETLIKQGIEAKGKPKKDTLMILGHKNAIKHIFDNSDKYKTLELDDLTTLHKILTEGLNVKSILRNTAVGITGTNYEPASDRISIKNAVMESFHVINNKNNPFEKALLTLLFISYIQPFTDGNKRTSRILSNAVLLAHDLFPLSFRNTDITEYKKATIMFYELNNLYNFKKIFIEQCSFAVEEYFHG